MFWGKEDVILIAASPDVGDATNSSSKSSTKAGTTHIVFDEHNVFNRNGFRDG